MSGLTYDIVKGWPQPEVVDRTYEVLQFCVKLRLSLLQRLPDDTDFLTWDLSIADDQVKLFLAVQE